MSRFTNTLLPCFALVSFSMVLSLPAYAAVKIGVVSAADKEVTIVGEDQSTRIATIGDHIFANDRISTNAKGKAQLMFEDRSTITINPNSEILIDQFIYDPNKSDGSMSVEGVKGAFRFIGGALSKKTPVKVKTPVATIGIRGGIMDTTINPNTGATDAVFLYGDQMTMTNSLGQTVTTSTSGTGFSVVEINLAPTTIPLPTVGQNVQLFTNQAGSGGGVATPPSSDTVKDTLDQFNTQPLMPTPTSDLETYGTQTEIASDPNPTTITLPDQDPAPTVFVEGDGISVTDMSNESVDAAITQRVGQLQQAVSNPEELGTIVDQQSIEENYEAGGAFQSLVDEEGLSPIFGLEELGEDGGVTIDLGEDVGNPDDQNTTIAEDSTVDDLVVPDPAAGNQQQPSVPETFTPVAGTSGSYIIVRDTNLDGTFGIQDQGSISITEASANNYVVSFTSAGASPDRDIIVPKLTQPGYNPIQSTTITENGVEEPRMVEGYQSKEGAAEFYNIMIDGPDDLEDKQIYFAVGQSVFDNTAATSEQDSYAMAVTASQDAALSGTVHAVPTEGILFYDFIPGATAGNVETPEVGVYDYSSAITPGADGASFGLAIDWGTMPGDEATMLSGDINWDDSNMSVTYLNENGAVSSTNDNLHSGIRVSYDFADPYSALGADAPGDISVAGVRVTDLFATDTSAIEAGQLEYVEAADTSPITGADTPSDYFAIPDTDIDYQGVNGFVLKDDLNNDPALIDAVNNVENNTTQKGFSAGVVYVLDGGGDYKADIYSSNFQNDVQSSADNGEISLDVTMSNANATTGAAGTNEVQAQFGNAAESSVYMNDHLYASQLNSASSDIDVNDGQFGINNAEGEGIAVSAAAMSDAGQDIPMVYHCHECQYVHWGMWSAELGTNQDSPSPDLQDQAAMIPYVVGDITNANNIPMTGNATYKGEAHASVAYENQAAENISGTMQATANLAGGSTQIDNFVLDFQNVAGAPLVIESAETAYVGQNYSQFGASTADTPNDPGVQLQSGVGAATDITGYMNGAFYGPNAEEIGGNYHFERTTDGLQGGGIYLGKQVP